jgi:hypothetical protein
MLTAPKEHALHRRGQLMVIERLLGMLPSFRRLSAQANWPPTNKLVDLRYRLDGRGLCFAAMRPHNSSRK